MIDLGLARIARLVAHTPQRWRALHVAGTNGKGSICAALSRMLHAAGVRTGRFTSPHLVDRWDCITIGEEPVSQAAFLAAEAAVRRRDDEEGVGASEFEVLTATAFEIFAREKVEMGVVEVGLGGRLDATNVLGQKAVTVISRIGLDHQSFLGDTLEAIAREKAGIMRAGVPCVVDSCNTPEVLAVLREKAREVGAEIVLSSRESAFMDELARETEMEPHQWGNMACAYTAFCLAYTRAESPLHRLLPAVKQLKWPGRLQMLDVRALTGRTEDVLLDGAHNAQSAEVLGKFVDGRLRKGGRVTWVLAASSGKALEDILSPLLKEGDCAVAVEFGAVDGMPWVKAMESAKVLKAASKHVDASGQYDAGGDLSAALRWAAATSGGGPMVIAGSLYLVSDVLRALRTAEDLDGQLLGS